MLAKPKNNELNEEAVVIWREEQSLQDIIFLLYRDRSLFFIVNNGLHHTVLNLFYFSHVLLRSAINITAARCNLSSKFLLGFVLLLFYDVIEYSRYVAVSFSVHEI